MVEIEAEFWGTDLGVCWEPEVGLWTWDWLTPGLRATKPRDRPRLWGPLGRPLPGLPRWACPAAGLEMCLCVSVQVWGWGANSREPHPGVGDNLGISCSLRGRVWEVR